MILIHTPIYWILKRVASLLNELPFCTNYAQFSRYEKKEEIWISPMKKFPSTTENQKRLSENTKTPPNSSITQRLQTDLGRFDGVTKDTTLVCLSRCTGSQTFHDRQMLCNQKDKLKLFMPPAWKVRRGHLVIGSSVCPSVCLSVCL